MRQQTVNRQRNHKNPTEFADRTDSVTRIGFEKWTLNLLISVLALSVFGAAGCVLVRNADPNGTTGVIQRIQVTNGRFERLSRPTLQGGDFWLRRGDTIHARWDEYTIYLSQVGANCDGIHFAPPACERCQFIHQNQNASECGMSFPPGDYLDLDTFSGLMSDSPFSSASLNSQSGDFGVAPGQTSAFRLSTTEGEKLDTWATTRVFLVDTPPSQGVPKLYKADDLPQPGVTDAMFYKVKVPDNYSGCDTSTPPHCLRISKIRVLKGVPHTTEVGFGLKDGGTLLKPSRIVMLPDFSDGSNVYDFDTNAACYARYPNGLPDTSGNIDLTSCYPCNSQSSCSPISKTANPEFIPPGGGQLTWAIEFKPAEGGEVPVLANGEVVALEFTIQAT